MSLAHLKLNPAIAKETARGEVQCLVCNMTVKPKVWTAHVVGKKHRDSAEKLKKKLAAGEIPASLAPKRTVEPVAEAVPVKKSRVDDEAGLPSDFFESSGGAPVETKPWHTGQEDAGPIVRERKGLIEGVPQGFFDDKQKDKLVRETAEKNEQMDADYEKLMREISEQDQVKEAELEREEDALMRQRELDYIDEQMNKLKELNELEKKRDAILEGRKTRDAALAAKRKQEEESDEDDDETEMLDFDDWRSMNALR